MKLNEMKQPQKQPSDAKAVSHHLQPDAQPGRDLLWQNSPQFYLWVSHHMVWAMSLVSLGELSQLSPLPACSQGQQSERWRTPWYCAGTAITKTLLSVTNTVLVTSLNYRTLQAVVKKMNSIWTFLSVQADKRVHGDCQPSTAGVTCNKK